MLRWLRGAGAGRAETASVEARISDALWTDVLRAHPFLDGLSADEDAALRKRCAWLLASKTLNGARGLVPTDFMRLSIAVQACLPILNLAPTLYDGWNEIIVYPGGFLVPRSQQDDAGVVHEYVEEAAGEAWEGGPIVLSWEAPDALAEPGQHAFNVVIHEFAHKLDLHAGDADGVPALYAHADISPRHWRTVLARSYDAFVTALEEIEAAIPPDVDPEGPEADSWYGQLPLDPYAATDEAEFFAVSSESFFVDPWPLAETLPDWYGLLAAYYRQDPLHRLRAADDAAWGS
ncbi:Inner membrane protein [plant metagenome]|uniref:Inner membrane protein n=1 Tax=plant metagenome TaxID=1297885 RepID=A0A484THV4_9ZZZZ